jgi:hypothetical protein
MTFYQRSQAHIWFNELTGGRYLNRIPKNLLENYRNNINTLNQALTLMEDDDLPPGMKHEDVHSVLDPVIIANYEIAEYRQLKNPHEYLDRLIRD